MSKTPFRYETTDASPGLLFWKAMSLWQRGISRALAPTGLSHTQFVVLASLAWLRQQGQQVTQRQLSDHTAIDAMTTSEVLRRLEKQGLVERHAHDTDTRARVVVITRTGTATIGKAVKAVESFDEDFFGALGPKRKDFLACMIALQPAQDR